MRLARRAWRTNRFLSSASPASPSLCVRLHGCVAGGPGPPVVAYLDAECGAACAERAVAQRLDAAGRKRSAERVERLRCKRPRKLNRVVHEEPPDEVALVSEPCPMLWPA